jgi:mono/diheme cytochrome c family protein
MRTCIVSLCVFAGLFSLTKLEGLPFGPPSAVYGQADSSISDRSPASSSPLKKATDAVGQLFQDHCTKCHAKDGRGNPGRLSFPDIPNFTTASWQAQRSDEELLTSILEGKGDNMPAFGKKIKKEQARDLVDHVRNFAPAKKKSKKDKPDTPGLSEFDEQFRRLQEEMDELFRQYRELSEYPEPEIRKMSEISSKKARNQLLTWPQ